MDLVAELARLNPDPALMASFSATLLKAQKDAEEIVRQRAEIVRKRTEIHAKDIKIQALTLELAHHKRMRFANKSEAFSPEQQQLFEESVSADESAIEAEVEQLTTAPKKRSRAGRQPLPDHLPRIEHRHEPETCNCGQCGKELTKIGEDVSEQLDVEPARFFVHRHIRPQYACRACESVVAEPVPAAVIDGGLAAPGLHAWVMIQKYL